MWPVPLCQQAVASGRRRVSCCLFEPVNSPNTGDTLGTIEQMQVYARFRPGSMGGVRCRPTQCLSHCQPPSTRVASGRGKAGREHTAPGPRRAACFTLGQVGQTGHRAGPRRDDCLSRLW